MQRRTGDGYMGRVGGITGCILMLFSYFMVSVGFSDNSIDKTTATSFCDSLHCDCLHSFVSDVPGNTLNNYSMDSDVCMQEYNGMYNIGEYMYADYMSHGSSTHGYDVRCVRAPVFQGCALHLNATEGEWLCT